MGQHHGKKQSQRSDLLQPLSLPRPQPSRTVLQSDQAMSSVRDYEKLAAIYLAFVQLASIRLWLAAVNESTPGSELQREWVQPLGEARANAALIARRTCTATMNISFRDPTIDWSYPSSWSVPCRSGRTAFQRFDSAVAPATVSG